MDIKEDLTAVMAECMVRYEIYTLMTKEGDEWYDKAIGTEFANVFNEASRLKGEWAIWKGSEVVVHGFNNGEQQ